jgi:hypothetical protein
MNCLRSLERWDLGFECHQGMHVCACLFCVCVFQCVQVCLATGRSSSKESYRLCIGLSNEKAARAQKRAVRPLMNGNSNDTLTLYYNCMCSNLSVTYLRLSSYCGAPGSNAGVFNLGSRWTRLHWSNFSRFSFLLSFYSCFIFIYRYILWWMVVLSWAFTLPHPQTSSLGFFM